jgi:hypothetical protein
MAVIFFVTTLAIFYGCIFNMQIDYDYDQKDWWYGGRK